MDVAPVVVTAVTGNSASNGMGTTESSAGVYKLSTDNSIVVTFSKNLSGGVLNATLSGCNATLGPASLVSGSNGTTVVWVLGNLASVIPGNTCILSVSGIGDVNGNPDDQATSINR